MEIQAAQRLQEARQYQRRTLLSLRQSLAHGAGRWRAWGKDWLIVACRQSVDLLRHQAIEPLKGQAIARRQRNHRFGEEGTEASQASQQLGGRRETVVFRWLGLILQTELPASATVVDANAQAHS